MIPKQLQQPEFRFCKLKAKDKVPFEKDWQNKGYEYRDLKLTKHIEQGGNYGVIGGYGKLRILDIDDPKLAEEMFKLLPTFTIKTGGGGMHFYFISDYETNHVLINEKGELRAKNYQVVGASCTHPNGKKYKIINDVEIINLQKEVIEELIKPHLREEQAKETITTSITKGKDTSGSGLEYRRVLAMIRGGKEREVIYKEMENYKKWSSAVEDYRTATYNNAMDYYLREKEKEEKPKEVMSEEETKELLKEIYEEIIHVLKKFCDVKEEYYSIIALWIIGTYMHDTFDTFPYLYFNAMKGSGKTRSLRLVSALSNNGELLGSMSESVLFRTAKGTTMCIDEFEQVNSQEKQSLRELLNSAYKKGQKIKRMKKTKDGYEVETFEVFTSICMANIWGMEEVLGDRCLTIMLQKSNKPFITKLIENFQKDEEITTLKSKLNRISCSLCMYVVSKDIEKGWNNYILTKYKSDTQHITTYSTLTTLTTLNYTFYDKIDEIGIDGRHFELTFPLLAIARYLDSFDDFLLIVKNIVQEKKTEDFLESKDVQLFDFVSQQDGMNFISISRLTNQFRIFIGVSEKEEDYVNSKWFGRALKRLALIREKVRKMGGVEVILDVTNAKKKMEMFR